MNYPSLLPSEWTFDARVLPRLRNVSATLAYVVLFAAAAELGYWVADAVRSGFPDTLVVKSTTALGMLAAALSILSPSNTLSRTLSQGALLLYLMMLLQYFIEVKWVESLLFESSLRRLAQEPTLIPASTTICLVLFSISLHLIRARHPRYVSGHLLTVGLFVFVYALLLAHLFGASATFRGMALYAIIPLSTSICFSCLSAALLLQYPGKGLTHIISTAHAGSRHARKAFLAITLAPLLIGGIVALLLKNFPFPAEFGIVLFFFLYFPLFLILAYFSYQGINYYDFQRGQLLEENRKVNENLWQANQDLCRANEQLLEANREIQSLMEQRLSQSESKFRELTESIVEMFFAVDRELTFLYWNSACEKLSGKPAGSVVGTSLYAMFPSFQYSRSEAIFLGVLENNTPASYEYYDKIKDCYLEVNVFPSKIGLSILLKDITEKKKKEAEVLRLNQQLTERNQELDQRNQELDQRNFELDQIVYKISHDIRSPLASVLGLLSLMEMEGLPPEVLPLFTRLRDQVLKLDRFTKAMLDFARTTRSGLQCQAVDLEKLLTQCLKELEYMPNYGRLQVRFCQEGQELYSDAFRLSIIMSNLLANAIKYQHLMQEQSYLDIRVILDEQQARLVFKDNGIGIQPQYLPRIFDMFFRATDQSQGSGLGMYIVRQTVEKLGGTIGLESTFGAGTTVTVCIPNQVAPLPIAWAPGEADAAKPAILLAIA